jgi:hypothetical protein
MLPIPQLVIGNSCWRAATNVGEKSRKRQFGRRDDHPMRFDTNFCLEELFGECGPPSIERTERALIVIVKSVKKASH